MKISLYNKHLIENVELTNINEEIPIFSNGNQNHLIGGVKINSDLIGEINFHPIYGNEPKKLFNLMGSQNFLLCIEGRISDDESIDKFTKLEIISTYITLNPEHEAIPKDQMDEYHKNVWFK